MEVPVILFWIFATMDSMNMQQIATDKYAEAVYQEEGQLDSLLISFRKNPKISTCALFDNPLIVGGIAARAKEFPHMASIGFGPSSDSKLEWLCGGSLISDKHVLTAAHCTASVIGLPQKVKLGTNDLNVEDDYIQEIKIETTIIHPDYKKPIKYHDIAILFLEKSVVFSAFVRPACLNTIQKFDYSAAVACGFGRTSFDKAEPSSTLLKVDLNIIPNANCSKYLRFTNFEMPNNIIKQMMCAGYLKGGKDTCQGDSGGPLQVILDDPYCMYSIIGITSFGRFCGMKFSPAIYTKVDEYVPWIEETIWN